MSKLLLEKLRQRQQAGNYRSLPNINILVDFCSNDYLGLAQSGALAQLIEEKYQQARNYCKSFNGSTGSRLISGNLPYAEELESSLARIFLSETTLLFNSGYAANMGVLSAIPQKGDTVLYDELSHASIKDGIRLSFADRFSFRHNDLNDLERKLQKAKGEKYIVVESIYSMDGDSAPLREMTMLCERYNAFLIVDEAHSTGTFGENGRGLVCQLGLQDKILVRIHTFGKAIGSHGACVAASQTIKDFLVNFSRQFIYTTAMPLHNLVSICCAFDFLYRHTGLQQVLYDNIRLFKENIPGSASLIRSDSAIQALIVPGNDKVKELAYTIQKQGFNIKPILSPTVKTGQERLRICLHSYNSASEIAQLGHLIATAV